MAKKLCYGQLDMSKITAAFKAGSPGFTKVKFKDGTEHIMCKFAIFESQDDKKTQYSDHYVSISMKKEEGEQAKAKNINTFIGDAKLADDPKPAEQPATAQDADDLPF